MGYLLDSHTLLWILYRPHLLSAKVRQALEQRDLPQWYSSVSLWELTIKQSLGKLDMDISLNDFFYAVRMSGMREIFISTEHLQKLNQLLYLHSDPFDRLLIAQAIAEDFTLISKDNAMSAYPVKLLW